MTIPDEWKPVIFSVATAFIIGMMWFVVKAIRDSVLKKVNEQINDNTSRIKELEGKVAENRETIKFLMQTLMERNS